MHTPSGVAFAVVGAKPARPAPTLLVLAADMQTTLKSYNGIGQALAHEGFISVSLDAPCHGADNTERSANELADWRTRIEQGDDLVKKFNARCSAVLDDLIAKGWTDPKRIVVAGTSRGGFLALHFAAAEPRLRAVVGFAPVVRLRALTEFNGTTAADAADALSLVHVASRLTGRPIWLCIGNEDRRVGTDDVIAFSREVVKASQTAKAPAQIELHITASQGHTVPKIAHAEAAAFVRAALSD